MNTSQQLRCYLGGAFFPQIFARHWALLSAATLTFGCSPGEDADTANSNQAPGKLTSDHVDISYRYEPGKRYLYEYEVSSRSKIGEALMPGMAGGSQEMRQTQAQKIAISVLKENPDGGKSLEIEFVSLNLEADTGFMKFSYDSEKPVDENDPVAAMLSPILKKVIGHKIQVELDENNQVVSASGTEKLLEEMTKSVDPQTPGMVQGMLDMFASEDYVENFIAPLKLPPHPVKPGDSWPASTTQNLGPMGVLSLDLQCQFESKAMRDGRETLSIAFSGTIESKANSEASEDGPMMEMAMEVVDGTVFGRHWYAPEIGMIVDSNTQMDTKMKMKMTLPAGLPGVSAENREVEMENHQKIHAKLLSVESVKESNAESDSSL